MCVSVYICLSGIYICIYIHTEVEEEDEWNYSSKRYEKVINN